MKKICIATLILACFLLSAPLISAHPGRTDEDGGHYDSGTGKYHYHHGYSAHNHYDMDGDGDKDCPHNFDDKTGWNSGNSTTNKTTGSYASSYTTTAKPPNATTVPKAPEAPSSDPVWLYMLSGLLFVSCVGLGVSSGKMHEKMKKAEKENTAALSFMRNSYHQRVEEVKQEQMQKYQEALAQKGASEKDLSRLQQSIDKERKELYSIRTQIWKEKQELYKLKIQRHRIKNAPTDVIIPEDGMPVWWKKDSNRPYGDYTVYVSQDTKVFHTDRLCASYRATETHVFHAMAYARPCKKCAENFFDFKEVPEWYYPKDIKPPTDTRSSWEKFLQEQSANKK